MKPRPRSADRKTALALGWRLLWEPSEEPRRVNLYIATGAMDILAARYAVAECDMDDDAFADAIEREMLSEAFQRRVA